MASRKMYVHLDMTQNQLQNTGFEQLAVAPTSPILAQQYWDTTTSKALIWDGTAWVQLGSDTTLNSLTTALTATPNGGAIDLAIADADTSNSGLLTSTFFDLLDTTTSTNAFGTIVLRDGAGVFSTNTVAGLQPPTADGQATNKLYVDNAIAAAIVSSNNYTDVSTTSGMRLKGNIDCTGNPDYPVAVVGDSYSVSFEGLIGGASGEQVRAGDLIICILDSAAGSQAVVGANWAIQERNLDIATDTVAGYVRISTAAENTTGTATDALPTVAGVTSMITAGSIGTYVSKLTAGAQTYAVNHNLNGSVICQIYNKVTGSYASADIIRSSSNSVTINVNSNLLQDHIFMATYVGVEPA